MSNQTKIRTNIRNLVKLLVTVTSIGFAVGAGSPALAETFVVNGNKALNTNNNFSKIDGQPRMSLWDYRITDRDQQFDRMPGNKGGVLLRHRSTGKCLNAHNPQANRLLNVWDCDPNDPEQNFRINTLGGNYVQIQLANTGFCVDSPTRNNGGNILLWYCQSSNLNQRWENFGTTPRLPWPNGLTGSVTRTNPIHYDGYNRPALDIALSAGTPVLAPANVKVVSQCDAGNNHRAMLLEDDEGQRYSLIHVNTSSIWVGRRYDKGQQIGVVASDTPQKTCASSTGPHLHMGLPNIPSVMGGYLLGTHTTTGTQLTAR